MPRPPGSTYVAEDISNTDFSLFLSRQSLSVFFVLRSLLVFLLFLLVLTHLLLLLLLLFYTTMLSVVPVYIRTHEQTVTEKAPVTDWTETGRKLLLLFWWWGLSALQQ
jgi:hypothetical protein